MMFLRGTNVRVTFSPHLYFSLTYGELSKAEKAFLPLFSAFLLLAMPWFCLDRLILLFRGNVKSVFQYKLRNVDCYFSLS